MKKAFEVLSRQEAGHLGEVKANAFERLIVASALWSLMHGLAELIIDGVGAMTEKVPDADLEVLVEKVLELGLPTIP